MTSILALLVAGCLALYAGYAMGRRRLALTKVQIRLRNEEGWKETYSTFMPGEAFEILLGATSEIGPDAIVRLERI